jgi:hypothetical protein
MNIYSVIPFKDEPLMTANVTKMCAADPAVKAILLCDNGSSEDSIDKLVELTSEIECTKIILDCSNLNIYEMWNVGWQTASLLNGNLSFNIAFLNNDIEFLDGTLSALSDLINSDDGIWVAYPDYNKSNAGGVIPDAGFAFTEGTYRHGGMSGWIFVVRGSIMGMEGFDMFDEQFEWWCGDDDFAFTVQKLGGCQARLLTHPSEHLVEATANNGSNEWTHEAKSRDMIKLQQKWGSR